MADDILSASLERERRQSNLLQPKWWELSVRLMLIGYGWQYFSVLLLIAMGFAILGTTILHVAKESNRRSMKLGFWYSFDMLLPIIRLRERHYTDVDLNTWAKYYFYYHKIVSYVLIFFVLAWLSGLVQEWGRAIHDSMSPNAGNRPVVPFYPPALVWITRMAARPRLIVKRPNSHRTASAQACPAFLRRARAIELARRRD